MASQQGRYRDFLTWQKKILKTFQPLFIIYKISSNEKKEETSASNDEILGLIHQPLKSLASEFPVFWT